MKKECNKVSGKCREKAKGVGKQSEGFMEVTLAWSPKVFVRNVLACPNSKNELRDG
jgi:hypothetical protein